MGERGPRWATLGTRLSFAFRRIADLNSIRQCRCLMRLALKFCWTRVADTAKRLLAAYSGREVAIAKTDRPLRLCVPKTLSELMTWWNRLSWRNDRAALFPSGRLGLTIYSKSKCRVGEDVSILTPHSPGRADF
jgi:hypothetical protein